MDMQQAKLIIAHFLKIDADDISRATVIDYTAVPSSLLLHRMYAALAEKDYLVDDPASITTYSDFLDVFSSPVSIVEKDTHIQADNKNKVADDKASFIGIDIEEISTFEEVDDYTNHQFYKDNFSLEEIGYCTLKENPLQSFAGLFSLKEAIVKADNSFKKTKFNKIKITHSDRNKPLFHDFSLSISHSEKHVVAVACKIHHQKIQSLSEKEIKQLIVRKMKDFAPTLIMTGVSILLIYTIIIYNFVL